MKLFKSLIYHAVNLFYSLLPPIEVDINKLIYPHREDINLRIDYIKNYLLKPQSDFKESDYFLFLNELNTHPYYINNINIEKHIKKFAELYYSIKSNNYQPKKYGYITIEKVRRNMKFVYPLKGKIVVGMDVTNKYILVEGAHRIAILKTLGYTKIRAKRVCRCRINSSDYTSFINSYKR